MSVPRPSAVVGLVAAVGAAAALAVLALITGTASAQEDGGQDGGQDSGRGISVVGVGTVSGTPDVLRFTVGVEVTADTVDAALSSANEAASRMISTLRERGVAEQDLQTASVQVHPRYDERGEQITGYVVRQDLTVTVTDLDAAGGLMTAAVDAGGDASRLSGVAFALEDDEELLSAAREQAYEKARDKAEQYARLAGKELGDVIAISEDVSQGPWPLERAGADLAAAASVPIEPGSTEVSVHVRVRWAMR